MNIKRWLIRYSGLRRSTSEAGAVPNIPDEPADDTAARLEIPADVASGITRDAVDLLLLMLLVADKICETDELAAALESVKIPLDFLSRTHSRLRGLPGFPAEMPGAALKRLVAALIDRNDGKDEPMLAPRRSDGKAALGRHTLPLNTQLERVRPAVALELVLARDASSPEDAAKEVLDLLRDSHAAALVRQWRTLRAGGASTAAESFKELVDETRRQIGAREMTADAYSAVIRTMLIPKR